ncbi:PTS IIA-like nitrogen regulatory protein PtsN [Natronospirillum operosum]|uniref:PTS IIA-like nitrogen regulatory protein PtsN n=1 Tax=Natronospirillum operosum TaxID=2759953 RepID=A0A4Z0WBS3_9GAMM|nr:PTS IIA-like nitrogen regulatory protein PtsN [Natronospirillum operosum]TGG90755.1 PTS IIA-like nitrogen regulatory protein PtsN [Natronospirillum operosum]
MTDLEHILTVERTLVGAPGNSKKKALELISEHLQQAEPGLQADQIFTSLNERERLGSTGFGNGVAIPHCRLEGCRQPVGMLVRLAEAIDFDAMDQKKVDLLFALVVPQEASNEHLQLLSRIAERFSDDDRLTRLRAADTPEALFNAFVRD